MTPDQTPINGKPARSRRARRAAENLSLAVEERLIWRGGEALKSAFEALRWTFERLVWAVQRGLIWPLQDRAVGLSGRDRALAGTALAIVAVAAVAGGATLAGSGGAGEPASATATAVAARPPVSSPATPATEAAPEPTLHGAAPVFKPTGKAGAGSEIDAAQPLRSAPPRQPATSSSTSAATGKISSVPSNSPNAARASTSAVAGRPAGPAAIAVARRFAGAFVLYETGGNKADVRKAFAATATRDLSRALLRRPPRLPANVKVPKAKVVNVVAGPSQGGIYSVSVSLLRVGVTSELRLEMEQRKHDGWQVTNVLG
jgi:hypothetical protein